MVVVDDGGEFPVGHGVGGESIEFQAEFIAGFTGTAGGRTPVSDYLTPFS